MDRSQSRIAFIFFALLAFCLMTALTSKLLLPAGFVWIGVCIGSLISLGNLAAVNRFAPYYATGGKVVIGFVGILLTILALGWFMSWGWLGAFTLAGIFVYGVASAIDS